MPTGEQYEIISGTHRAVVTEVGATLRSFSVEVEMWYAGSASTR